MSCVVFAGQQTEMCGFGIKEKLFVCGKEFCFKQRTFQCVQTQCCCELPCGMDTYEWTLVINLDLLSSYFVNNYETSNTFQGFSFLFLSFIIILRVESKLHAANVLLFTTHMAYISKHNETWKNTTHHLYLYTYCIIAICVLLLLCLH